MELHSLRIVTEMEADQKRHEKKKEQTRCSGNVQDDLDGLSSDVQGTLWLEMSRERDRLHLTSGSLKTVPYVEKCAELPDDIP